MGSAAVILLFACLTAGVDASVLTPLHSSAIQLTSKVGLLPGRGTALRGSSRRKVLLLDNEAGVHSSTDTKDKRVNEALLDAINKQDVDAVKKALKEGADPSYQSTRGATPVSEAIDLDNKEILELLIESGADLDEATAGLKERRQDVGVLQLATILESANAVQVLLDAGVPVDKPNFRGETALHYAAVKLSDKMGLLLIDAGATIDIETQNIETTTPLYLAARFGALQMVKLLISKGADVNNDSAKWGLTPLIGAAYADSGPITRELIAQGANINAQNFFGYTALYLAAYYGHQTTAQILIDKGANKNIESSKGDTPLDALCACTESGDPEPIVPCNSKVCDNPKDMRKLLS